MTYADYVKEHALVINLDRYITPVVDQQDVSTNLKQISATVSNCGFSVSGRLEDLVARKVTRDETTSYPTVENRDDLKQEWLEKVRSKNWSADMISNLFESVSGGLAELYVMEQFFESDREMIYLEITPDDDLSVRRERAEALHAVAGNVAIILGNVTCGNMYRYTAYRKDTLLNVHIDGTNACHAQLFSTRRACRDFDAHIDLFVDDGLEKPDVLDLIANYACEIRSPHCKDDSDGIGVDEAIGLLRSDIRKTKQDLGPAFGYALPDDYGYVVDLSDYEAEPLITAKVGALRKVIRNIDTGSMTAGGIVGNGRELKRFMDAVVEILLKHANSSVVKYEGIAMKTDNTTI